MKADRHNFTSRDLYAVILAGGTGTRFWPLSRAHNPKQFLSVIGDKSLLQMTVERVRSVIPVKNFFIVTNQQYAAQVKHQLKKYRIPPSHVLPEPQGKNTAPAIGWVASRIHHINPQAVMVVLPSDHLIRHRIAFLRCLQEAVHLARKGFLVTMGIVPTRPETGYGYLKITRGGEGNQRTWRVEKFVEKPDRSTAQKFLKLKTYLWNSGMFVWRTAVILEEYKKHLPGIFHAFARRSDTVFARKVWPRLPSISVDYGILEHSRNIAAVPAQGIGWSDLGSWESLDQVLPKDKNGNVFRGDIMNIDSRGTFVFGDKRLVAVLGLDKIVVVDTPDALLVCRKDLSQKVRELTQLLKSKKRNEL